LSFKSIQKRIIFDKMASRNTQGSRNMAYELSAQRRLERLREKTESIVVRNSMIRRFGHKG
jgi:hypothetical protein